MAQDQIDKIITIQFKYSDLLEGWEKVSEEIDKVNAGLKQLKQDFKEGQISSSNYRRALGELTTVKRALNDQMRQYNREIQNNIREEIKQEGSIDQLRASIGKLTSEYNKLSREERKAAKGSEYVEKISKMQTELNEANAALLNFRDNVGNYASAAKGFTPLSFQVQQLAREIPSLTMSLRMFFLAISNNFPMFVDELKRARVANAALRAEGKATVPVFKQVVSSIFSWQTALVVGITLLTAYGKEIGEWVKSLFDGRDAAISMAEAQEKVNDALSEDDRGVAQQIVQFEQLRRAWNDLGDDLTAKKKFIAENKDAFNNLGVSITGVKDAENLFVDNADAFIESLKLRAQATAGFDLAVEAYKKALKEQQKAQEEIEKGYTTTISSAGGSFGGGFTEVTRQYTEDEKKQIMSSSEALFAQADAYINLANAKEQARKETLELAGIEETANEEQIKRLLTLEELQNRMRQKNLDKHTKAVESWRISLGKAVAKMEGDLDKAMGGVDKSIIDDFKKQAKEQEQAFQNRINAAYLEGGDLGAARELLEIYKEQLDLIDQMEGAYRLAGKTDEEIQAIRIEARENVQKAEEDIAKIQLANTQKGLNAAATTAGAMASAFEALGGEGERYAEFVKAFSVMNVILAQASAIANAVASGSKAPWFMIPLTIAAAIASVTAAIASAVNTTKSTEVPKYAEGGLITGPGTGTSDSIIARVSNGEGIMTAQAVTDWGAILSAINVSSGGRPISTSRLPERGDGMRGMKRMMKEALMEMPNPIVLVKDIDHGQKRVKVAASLGKLGRSRRN